MTVNSNDNGGKLSKIAWFLSQENVTVASYRTLLAFLTTVVLTLGGYLGTTVLSRLDRAEVSLGRVEQSIARIEQQLVDAHNNGGQL